jgi:hypothetical protein
MKSSHQLLCTALLALALGACSADRYPDVPKEYHALLDAALAKAGTHADTLRRALATVPPAQREGMAYLIAYMPDSDLTSLPSQVLIDNVSYAYRAREEFPWCAQLPDSIFFAEVLPYYNITEERDNWRPEFHHRFAPMVEGCPDMTAAIYAVNRRIRDELLVDYNTARRASDQGPFESIETHMASCSGLTILLVDAFRSVGIPARFAGTANWFDNRGNHSWAEVLLPDGWHFTEYYMEDLDRAWFASDAARATVGSDNNGIFAVSYRPTGTTFPVVWDEARPVNAIEVTPRYLETCAYAIKRSEDDNRVWLTIDGYNAEGYSKKHDNRIAVDITLRTTDGAQVGGGTTCDARRDLNDALRFLVEPNRTYNIIGVVDGNEKTISVKVGEKDMKVDYKL